MFIEVIVFNFGQAIHGFRETERKHWYPHNREVLERVRQVGFDGEIMPYIHILDLAPQGLIKPHVDSTRVSVKNSVEFYVTTK